MVDLGLESTDGDECNLDKVGQLINDLIMCKDASKSSIWLDFSEFVSYLLILQRVLTVLFLGGLFFSSLQWRLRW